MGPGRLGPVPSSGMWVCMCVSALPASVTLASCSEGGHVTVGTEVKVGEPCKT